MSHPKLLEKADLSNYRLTFSRFPDLSLNIYGVSLPDVTLGIQEMQSPTIPIKVHGTSLVTSELIVSFYVDELYWNYRNLLYWIFVLKEFSMKDVKPNPVQERILQMENQSVMSRYYSDAVLTLYNLDKQPVLKFNYQDAWPSSLSGITMGVQDKKAVATCDCTFAFTGFDFPKEDLTLFSGMV